MGSPKVGRVLNLAQHICTIQYFIVPVGEIVLDSNAAHM